MARTEKPGLGDGAHDAVDQERAVGLDDLEQVALQVGPVAFGAADADGGIGQVRRLAEAPEVGQGGPRRRDVEAGQLLGRPVVLGLGGEAALRRVRAPLPKAGRRRNHQRTD
jgi:hypothetical protein